MTGNLVVDTNVWVHGSEPSAPYHREAANFMVRLLRSSISLAVDPGFSIIKDKNRSRLVHEYLNHVRPVHHAYQVLVTLASNRRIVEQVLTGDQRIKKSIKRLVKGAKPCDRMLLNLAVQTTRKELVTHDFEDFQSAKRPVIRRELGVSVCTAAECDV